jgi:hypothetical protein
MLPTTQIYGTKSQEGGERHILNMANEEKGISHKCVCVRKSIAYYVCLWEGFITFELPSAEFRKKTFQIAYFFLYMGRFLFINSVERSSNKRTRTESY